ncbi:Prephenate dehydrogenase [Candidatus Magnetomoraceae bacterium gMMP-15]
MGLISPKVGIIGGTQGMGVWFADYLEDQGIEVLRAGRKTSPTLTETASQCDVVIISVPIAITVDVIKELGQLVSKQGVIMDLTSIKKEPLDAMLNYSNAEVVGLHPLFGPEVKAEGQRVVICRGRGKKGLTWISEIFNKTGIHSFIMNPEKHDNLMGLIQGVNHFSTLALGLCIKNAGFEFEDILNCSTKTFKDRLNRISSMLNQRPELFSSLLIDNKKSLEFIDIYQKSAKQILDMVSSKDRDAFDELFESLRQSLTM